MSGSLQADHRPASALHGFLRRMKIMASVVPAARLTARIAFAACFVAALSAGLVTMVVSALR
ncbi:hypothetical protein GCM10027610_003540 [Dactylosporangium cerinum]